MINGMEHIGLCAENPRALRDWYAGVLGLRVVYALEERATYFMRAPDGGMLEIYPSKNPVSPVDNLHRGWRHVALSVSDVDAEVARLRSSGTVVPPDSIVATSEMKIAFFRDPEGNLLHLVQRNKEIPTFASGAAG
jgi:glyoxylase I family protein